MGQSQPSPPTQPGSNTTAKWLVLGCGGCLGLTVLASLALAFFIDRTLRFAVGPTLDTADTAELFTYALPGESRGMFNFGLLGMQLTQVTSTADNSSVLLTMGQMPRYIQGREAQQRFLEEFQEQVTVEGSYEMTESRLENRTLCGQTVAVMAQSGQFEENGALYSAASLLTFVEYNSNTRFVWLLTHGEAPEATADQVFATLDCR